MSKEDRAYITDNLRQRLKFIRRQKFLTQQQAADMSGITRNAYKNIEGGRTVPHVSTLYMIARAFNVQPGWLIGTDEFK